MAQVRWTDVATGAQRIVNVEGANYDEGMSIAQALSYWAGATDVAYYNEPSMGWIPCLYGDFIYARSVCGVD